MSKPDQKGGGILQRRGYRLLARLGFAGGVFLVFMVAWFIGDSWREYRYVLDDAARQHQQLAVALGSQASSELQVATATLNHSARLLRDYLAEPSNERLAKVAAVAHFLTGTPMIENVILLDAAGRSLVQERPSGALARAISEGDYSKTKVVEGARVFEISDAVFDSNRQTHLLIMRSVVLNEENRTLGQVIVVLNLGIFQAAYDALRFGLSGSAALFRTDGVLLVRTPYDQSLVNRKFSGPLFKTYLPRAANGNFIDDVQIDRSVRVVGYASVPGFPFVVATSIRQSTALVPWRRALRSRIIGIVATLLALGALFIVGYRLFRHGERAFELAEDHRERMSRMINNIPGGVFVLRCEPDGKINYHFLSARIGQIAGIDPDAAIADSSVLTRLLHPDDAARIRSEADRFAVGEAGVFECRIIKPSGELRWVRVHVTTFVAADGVPTADGVLFDITESKLLEEQHLQSLKMEAVGRLTGGIAHDFNNLLTVIIGNAELLSAELGSTSAIRPLADIILAAAMRSAELTRSLLVFSRKQSLNPKPTDINRLLSGMEGLLRRTLGEDIKIILSLNSSLYLSRVDPGQIETAVINLVVNARDAMPQGGTLTIKTDNVELDEAYARLHEGVLPGHYVMLTVADTGSGMSADVQAHAFEPFFTTKEVGKGTGLGLSMVYGVVKQLGGSIDLHSAIGQGTTIILYLPRAVAGIDADGEHSEQPPAAGSAGETILLVEDDDIVRSHVARQLMNLGYQVSVAGDGAEALAMLKKDPTIDLLFTDVVMPGGMSGPQLAEEAVRLRPRLKVLYTSGNAENTLIGGAQSRGRIDMLNKPYRQQELANKLRQILG